MFIIPAVYVDLSFPFPFPVLKLMGLSKFMKSVHTVLSALLVAHWDIVGQVAKPLIFVIKTSNLALTYVDHYITNKLGHLLFDLW